MLYEHLVRARMKLAVVVVRVVVAEARESDEVTRKRLVGGLHRDAQLRPAVESVFPRDHQLAVGQLRFELP